MRGKLPKTELLITFEAVARHESYTRAAEELALTQSAVFRQMAALESFLNIALFNRAKKRISLNEAGKYYLEMVRDTLNKFERDTHAIMTWQPTSRVIALAVNPTLSTHWLIPKLGEFNKSYPDIVVNINSLASVGDFLNRDYDAAIMREDFCAPLGQVDSLFEEELLPVCSRTLPGYTGRKITVERLLDNFTLLHQSTRIESWAEWFSLSAITSPRVKLGPRFDLISMLIAAVRSRLGVALLPRFSVQHDLDNGSMVIPCDVPMRTGNRFILTWRDDGVESGGVLLFRDWLLKKSAVEQHALLKTL